ncbi:MAG TPA: hypothetical protein VIA29_11485 [Thermoanaerobaculia bacterium]|jgi:hypothetical protein
MKRTVFTFLAALLLAAAPAMAYVVKLKDGSLIFARGVYEVKGRKAIIVLENGTVTQIDFDKVDVPGTQEYNKKYSGNVVAIETGDERLKPPVPTPPTKRIQDLIRENKTRMELPRHAPAQQENGTGESWMPVDPVLQSTFQRILDGAGIQQYRVQNYRGTVRLLATANTEEAVFNTLAAAARALGDWGNRGNQLTIEIQLTTSSNEAAGSFLMSTDQARQIVNGQITTADYFLRAVIL